MSILIDFAAAKAAVPMDVVLAHYGIDQKRGFALCPFHNDRHPSMRIYRDGFYCFVCGTGGDTIRFVSLMEGVKNTQAAKILADIGGLTFPDGRDYRSREMARKRAQERRLEAERINALSGEYDRLCAEFLWLRSIADSEYPFTDAWCEAQRKMPVIDGRLDELFAELGALDGGIYKDRLHKQQRAVRGAV